ncbi:MAG TPA: SWIM zinc finger family protein [Ktedonobacterales bacterium]|nr:SWIM zinc finger family protein [Ktedonobacterales bacterium]
MSEAAAATVTAPTITARDVEDWCNIAQVRDARKIVQKGDVLRPWVAGSAIHAEVQGSGSTPYRIDITFKDAGSKPSSKCSCPAWRSNPLCKHVTAVLLAWAGKPDSFAVVEAPPVVEKPKTTRAPKKAASDTEGEAGDSASKTKTDANAAAARQAELESGISQATDLLTELCARGLLAVTSEQADAVLKLAELLISQRLNLLGRRVQMLAIRLRQVSDARTNRRGGQPAVDETDFAALLADAWLTLAATRSALQADPASEASTDLEDLLGTKFDESRLNKSQSAALLEVAFEEETDEIGFVTDTNYLLDLESGEVMLERQILPARLAERGRKRPYNSVLVNCQIASSRSQPPRRVKVSGIGQKQPINADALARAARHAVTTVAVLRRRLAQQMADPLAPRELLALFAPQALQATDAAAGQGKAKARLLVVDAEGVALPIEGAASAVLGLATQESILALFGRLKLNERGDAFVFAPLSVLCTSGKLQMLS